MHKHIILAAIALVLLGAACQKKAAPTPEAATGTVNGTQNPIANTPNPIAQAPANSPSAGYRGDLTVQMSPEEIMLTGSGTQGLDVDSATGFVYLGNNGSVISKCAPVSTSGEDRDTMSIVDPAQKKEIARVKTDSSPIWPLVDVARDVVYMANSGGAGTISVHRRGTGTKLQSIPVGGRPHMVAMFDNLMVVSNTFDKSQTYYSVIDLTSRKVTAHYTSPNLPHPVVVDPDKKVAYMMGVQDGQVTVIDMTTGQAQETFTLSGAGGQLAISKKFNRVFAGATQPGTAATAFDLTTHAALSPISFTGLNAPGTSVIVDDAAGLLLVVIADQDAIGVASASSLQPLGYFKVGTCPYGVRLDPSRGLGFVSNSGSHTLTMFDLKKVRDAVE